MEQLIPLRTSVYGVSLLDSQDDGTAIDAHSVHS